MDKGIIVGYARVSTAEQNEGRQMKSLKENAKAERVYLDKLSGKNTNRPKLKEMIDFVRAGDTVVVSEYSRLARSTEDLLHIVNTLHDKGVTVISQKENLDTSTPTGKLMLTVLAGIAEFERAMILQRQKEGIALAKEQGKYKGRKATDKPDNWTELYDKYMHRELSATALAKACNVSRTLLYRWINAEKENGMSSGRDTGTDTAKDKA